MKKGGGKKREHEKHEATMRRSKVQGARWQEKLKQKYRDRLSETDGKGDYACTKNQDVLDKRRLRALPLTCTKGQRGRSDRRMIRCEAT